MASVILAVGVVCAVCAYGPLTFFIIAAWLRLRSAAMSYLQYVRCMFLYTSILAVGWIMLVFMAFSVSIEMFYTLTGQEAQLADSVLVISLLPGYIAFNTANWFNDLQEQLIPGWILWMFGFFAIVLFLLAVATCEWLLSHFLMQRRTRMKSAL